MKKLNKKMKIVIGVVILIAIIVVIALLSMGGISKSEINDVVENMMAQIKEDETISSIGIGSEIKEKLFENLEWEVSEIKKEGEMYTFKLDTKNINIKNVYDAYQNKIIENIAELSSKTEQDYIDMFVESFEAQAVEEATATIQIKKDENGDYQVVNLEELYNALIPGISEIQ